MKSIEEGIFPSDLKNMTGDELEVLCAAIREKIISTVAQNGGHLASNLGIVELTVAIHRVFDAPRDKIIWDVGHQSYVHKLLTGRGGSFNSLRRLDGISGFPKRAESEYDTFDTGHSSNSISAGLGMAAARDIKGEDYAVAAVIGDGALTGGMAYEALNNAGAMDTSLVVILNDNAMSISKDHGSMSQHLAKLRSSDKYNSLKQNVKSALIQIPGGRAVYTGLDNLKDVVKYMFVQGVLFEELGFTYLGPVDGHNLEELTEVLTNAKNMKKPVLVHCITEKGKGYRPAEVRPEKFHGVGPFDSSNGMPLSPKKLPDYSDIFGMSLTRLAERDDRVVAISAAMVDGTGLGRFARAFPDRFFDTGIAEEHAVTFAAGLAAAGMKPFVAIYSTFMQRAYDQMLIDVCMQKLPVVFCLDRAGVVGADGETHNGVFDLSYMLSMPELTIFAPSDGMELARSMRFALNHDGPCAIRYPRGSAPAGSQGGQPFAAEPSIKREGTQALLVGVGSMTDTCMEAAELLEEKGLSVRVVDARILKPLSPEIIEKYRQWASGSGRLFVVEDNVGAGGFGSVLSSIFAADDSVKVYSMAWPDSFIPHGNRKELLERYGLDSSSVAERVRGIIEGKA